MRTYKHLLYLNTYILGKYVKYFATLLDIKHCNSDENSIKCYEKYIESIAHKIWGNQYNQFLRVSINHFKEHLQAHIQYGCIDECINKA